MNIKLSLVGIAFFAFAAAGCANIRVVKKTQTGGEVALLGSREGAQEKANEYMARHCPAGYDVLEEGEAVVGQNATTTTRPTKGLFGGKQLQSDSSTEDKREWRVKYQCKGAESPSARGPAGAPGGAGPPPGAPPPPPAPVAPAAPAAALKTSRANPVREVVVTF